MFWIKLIKKFVKILQSNVSPMQIAGGMALGMMIGLTPFFTLFDMLIIVLVIALNVNIASVLLSMAVFGIIGQFTDPLSGQIGYRLLAQTESLVPIWTALYNMPFVPFMRFNNTVVMGGFAISAVLFMPVLLGVRKFVIAYRAGLNKKIENWKIVKAFKVSKIYDIYKKFRP